MRAPHWTDVLESAKRLHADKNLDWSDLLSEAENGAAQWSTELRGKPTAVVIRNGELKVRTGAAEETEIVLSIWADGHCLARLHGVNPYTPTT